MALTQHLSDPVGSDTPHRRCSLIRDTLIQSGLYAGSSTSVDPGSLVSGADPPWWRLSPSAFPLSTDQVSFFRELGQDLLALYRAVNRLYFDSVHGAQPAWVAGYLDQGKPESLISYSRMNRFRDHVPAVIRPDMIPTQNGMVITELDSVPGGIGLTACLSQAYADLDRSAEPSHQPATIIGGRDGMLRGFAAMLRGQQGSVPGCVAIIVSDEAKDYRPEMQWLAARLREIGLDTYCVDPRQVHFTEEGLFLEQESGRKTVGLIYRFYELFDLKNIPKSELVLYAAKKGYVAITPPYKPALEEKSSFALIHHPSLRPFWQRELGEDTVAKLIALMPRTWILDPAPIPPTAVIPHLEAGGRAVSNWRELASATQKERHFVVKPSGFSELAWGSRGVSVGHDLSQSEWTAAIEAALSSFSVTPYVLQEFHKGRSFDLSYLDPPADAIVPMTGRARLSPYYFVTGEKAELGGILATVCALDKKVIHGMRDAIMTPCAIAPEASGANSEC
ncbi:MAG: hypothetical protein ACT4OO_07910 [Nitrospiraceae bacterium]